MTTYTNEECAAINAAWQAISHLCSCTNWSDGPQWKEALRLERQQAASDERQKTVWARAMICKGWLEGMEAPDKPASEIFWIRPGYLQALFLGVRHSVERKGTDHCGPMVDEAAGLCRAAIAANDAHTRRIVEG